MTFSCRRIAAITLGLIFTALPLQAQGIKGFFEAINWSVRGTLLLFPEDNGNSSAPMPILPSLGGAAAYPFSDLFDIEVSLDLYGNTYDYDVILDRVVPANDEFRSAFVMGFVLGFQPVFSFNPKGDKFTIRVYGGLAFDLRIVFPAYGIEDSESHTNDKNPHTGLNIGQARQKIASYFWGSGRFILPFLGGGMDFPITEGLDLGFDLRIWMPVWRIWSGEDLPFVEGFRIGIGFRLGFK
ncbi:MAG: hypothetical protein FWG29_10830 [Treponema sp.]|nr:hypothetical protein [Treponema sp.]